MRTQLWPLPVLAVVLAVAAGLAVPALDRRVGGSLPGGVDGWVFGGDPGAARTVLDAVASSLITVTSLTFSLTVVTLQLASSQFSPRLLRTFTQDLFVQVTLSVFLATFVYSLTVLRAVRSGAESQPLFVPRIAVTVAFLLAVVSVIALVLFLAHLTRQIRVETVLETVHRDAGATIAAVLDNRPERESSAPLPQPPSGVQIWSAPTSGFFLAVDVSRVATATAAADAVAIVDVLPGTYVVAGTPIGRFWRVGTDDPASDARSVAWSALPEELGSVIEIGAERTAAQDVAFGLRQLTDVANKALSPGINDPTTAVHALGHIAAVLSDLAGRELGPVVYHDADDQVRVGLNRPGLDELLDVAVAQPRRYGAADVQVAARLITVLRDVAWHVRPDDRPMVLAELARMRQAVDDAGHTPTEHERLAALSNEVEDVLSRPTTSSAATT